MIYALLSALAWSVMDMLRKRLARYASPLTLAIWLALGVTPLYVLAWGMGDWGGPEPDYWLPGLLSVVAASLAAFCFMKALSVGRIATLIPVLSVTPVIASLLSWLLLADTLTLPELLAIAVIVVAVFLLNGGMKVITSPDHAGPGFGLMLVVSACWGVVIVLDQWALRSAPLPFHGVVQSGGMFLLLSCVAWATSNKGELRLLPVFNGHVGLLLLAIATFASAVSLQWLALETIHAGILETVKRGVGIIGAAVWGVWLFHERVTIWQLILMLVVILATSFLSLS